MRLFGFRDPKAITVGEFKLRAKTARIGDDLIFDFKVNVASKTPIRLRLEYAVFYTKARNKISKKVFKISEKKYVPGVHEISRKQSFSDKSTRKHYPGNHEIAIIINGIEKARIGFNLSK